MEKRKNNKNSTYCFDSFIPNNINYSKQSSRKKENRR